MFRSFAQFLFHGAACLAACVSLGGCLAGESGKGGGVVVGEGLQNLRKVTDGVWSGGEPKSGADFSRLKRLGVKMVVSVDGARPDADAARSFGLRYVHVPIGYDGIHEAARLSLARVAGESGGDVFIHCHHGRHRAPAAAALVCLTRKAMETKDALAFMEKAGTSRDYGGLWRDVRNFRPPAADVRLPELTGSAEVDSLTQAMAGVDRAWDRLELLRANRWKRLTQHPYVEASREALLLAEGFHESVRALDAGADDRLAAGLREAENTARQLQAALKGGRFEKAGKLRNGLKRSCAACHRSHRN